jgi:hypothetical protein
MPREVHRWFCVCMLLSSAVARADAGAVSVDPAPRHVAIDAAAELSTYGDSDQVAVLSPSIAVTLRDPDGEWRASARYLVDVVSAASVDIVATASQRWSEVRHEVSGSAGFRRGDVSLGASASSSIEPDYAALSGGLNGGLALDDDNLTLALGYVVGHDVAGRTGTPFRVFEHAFWKHGPSLGASFVLNPSSLLFVGADVAFDAGDQAKPYRYVPLFDRATAHALPRGASVARVDRERLPETPLERLPQARARYAITVRYKHRADAATVRAEERLYIDSWGLLATTSDVRWAFDLARTLELAPTLRVHAQTGTSFWRRAYIASESDERLELPAIRTGDRELGPLWTVSVGADLRWSFAATSGSPVVRLRVVGMRTGYLDSLFIEHRFAIFSGLSVEGSY